MPAGLAVPLILGGIGAGTSLASAKIQSGAAKNAAKTQAASADKALQLNSDLARQAMGLQGSMWEGIRGMYNPYVASAPATLGALHSFLEIPGAAQAQGAVPPGTYGPPMMGGGAPRLTNPGGPAMPPGMGGPPPPISAFGGPLGQTYARARSPQTQMY